MEDSIEFTIDKIKNKEHENNTKLTEKRTYENTIAATNRHLRDTIHRNTKLKEESLETSKLRDALEAEVFNARVRHRALFEQLTTSTNELKALRAKSEEMVLNVWDSRNSLCEKVQNVADQCDVWALFTKPKHIEIPAKKQPIIEYTEEKSIGKLNKALERRQKLLEKRERLMHEPDRSEEFIRITNAIRYSEEMTANMKN